MSGNIDCLVLDLRLPILSGLEVYLTLKSAGCTVPTDIVTGYAEEEAESIDELRSHPVTGCLTKPFEPKALLQAIETAMHEES
jgi:CheY-like chemotaxis protein